MSLGLASNFKRASTPVLNSQFSRLSGPQVKVAWGWGWFFLPVFSRKLLEEVPDTLQDVTSSFAKGILRDSFPISSGMDDRILSKVYWSCHNRGHTSLKLLVDYHSTINGWASSTQWFNLHIYNLMCSQNCLFRVPLQQLHSRENIFKEPCQLSSAFFSGWGPEEGGSHSSGGALIKSINSFWSSNSHQSPPRKSRHCLKWNSRRKETSLVSARVLVFMLRIPHHLRLCEDMKHAHMTWREDSMPMFKLGRKKTFENEEFTEKAFCSFGVRGSW